MPLAARAPEPDRTPLRTALALATVLLVALGLPVLLELPPRAGAATTLAVLVAALAARAAQRPPARDEGALLRAMADTLPEGIVVVADGRIASLNPAARRLLGLADACDAPAASLFDDEAAARAALAAGACFDGETLLRHRDGTPLPVRLSARDLYAHAGAPPARLLLFVDLSEDRALAARLDAQRAELETLARRLLTVQEDERASISRELHDDIGQAITAIKLCASALAHERDPPRAAAVRDAADEIGRIADQTVAKLRDLSLLLRPPQLDALGLEAALRWQASTLFRGDWPRLELDIPPLDCRPPHDVELACFRIAQEALTNVLRHARAGRVRLSLRCDDVELRLSIEDDGRGIDPAATPGLGLITMRERARQLGGTLEIDSRVGRTRIDAVLPLQAGATARDGVPRG